MRLLNRRVNRLLLIGLAFVMGVYVVTAYTMRGLPSAAAFAWRDADSMELLSLRPVRGPDRDAAFHRFPVLGRTAVTDPAVRQSLFGALQSSARWGLHVPAMCFNPRHGVHLTHAGRIIDVLVCFECEQGQVWEGDQFLGSFPIGDSPQDAFDDVLRSAGVRLPTAADEQPDDEPPEDKTPATQPSRPSGWQG